MVFEKGKFHGKNSASFLNMIIGLRILLVSEGEFIHKNSIRILRLKHNFGLLV